MPKKDYIMFRTTKEFKAEINQAAEELGLKMSSYITMTLKAKNKELLEKNRNKG